MKKKIFGLTIHKREIPTYNIIADIESNIKKINPESHDELKLKITNVVNNFKRNGSKHKSKFLQLSKEIKEARIFVKNNPDIIFTRAYKGNTTVALTPTDYNEKVETLLHDVNTYQVRPKDTTMKIQNKLNGLVKKWENKKFINNLLAKDLKTSNAVPSRLYGLPKIYKEGNPIRPIVSYVGSPTYNLASFFSSVISKNTTPPKSKLINSFELVQKFKTVSIPNNFVLASLDVVSLFTNVPKEAAISSVKSRWEEIRPKVQLPWTDFEEGLQLCLNSTDFKFNGITFFQKRGLPICSPFSHILANLVNDDLEKEKLVNLDFEVQIPNANPLNIRFSLEKESESAINFMDITITKKQNQKLHNSNLKLITDTLVENDYPLSFVQEIINQRLLSLEQKTRLGNNHVNINTENKPFVSLPYVEGLPEKISGILRSYNINTAFKNQKNLNLIFKQTKDKLPIE